MLACPGKYIFKDNHNRYWILEHLFAETNITDYIMDDFEHRGELPALICGATGKEISFAGKFHVPNENPTYSIFSRLCIRKFLMPIKSLNQKFGTTLLNFGFDMFNMNGRIYLCFQGWSLWAESLVQDYLTWDWRQGTRWRWWRPTVQRFDQHLASNLWLFLTPCGDQYDPSKLHKLFKNFQHGPVLFGSNFNQHLTTNLKS